MKFWILGLGFLLHVSGTLMAREALQFACTSKAPLSLSADQSLSAAMRGTLEFIGFNQVVLSHTTQLRSCRDGAACETNEEISQFGVLRSADYKPSLYKEHDAFSLLAATSADPKRSRVVIPEKVSRDHLQDFTAVLIFSDWKKLGGQSLPLECKADIVASDASDEMKSADNELKRAQAILAEQFGLNDLQLRVSSRALQEQVKASRECTDPRCISFSHATQLALSLIFDSQAQAETPLEIALSEIPKQPGAWNNSEARKAAAKSLLREELDRSQTRLSLFTGSEAPELALPPEQGENAEENWIFSLYIPSLSDHFYWVVVDKQGIKKPYIYGFN